MYLFLGCQSSIIRDHPGAPTVLQGSPTCLPDGTPYRLPRFAGNSRDCPAPRWVYFQLYFLSRGESESAGGSPEQSCGRGGPPSPESNQDRPPMACRLMDMDEGRTNFWSGRWESKSSPLGFSRTYEVGLELIWKDLVVSGTLTAASMPPCFPNMFLTTLRFASRTALGTACV